MKTEKASKVILYKKILFFRSFFEAGPRFFRSPTHFSNFLRMKSSPKTRFAPPKKCSEAPNAVPKNRFGGLKNVRMGVFRIVWVTYPPEGGLGHHQNPYGKMGRSSQSGKLLALIATGAFKKSQSGW